MDSIRYAIILFILTVCLTGFGQTYFNTTIDVPGSNTNFAGDVVAMDSGYYVFGNARFGSVSYLTVTRLNNFGNEEWTEQYGSSPEFRQADKVFQKNDTTLILISSYESITGTIPNISFVQFNTLSRTFFGENIIGESNYNNVIKNSSKIDSNVFLLGFAGEIGNNNISKAYVVNLDLEGNIKWANRYGVSGKNDEVISIVSLADGGYLVGGGSDRTDAKNQWTIMKIDSQGNELWLKEYGESGKIDYLAAIHPAADGNFFVTSSIDKLSNGSPTPRIYKINDLGEIIWKKEFVGIGNNYAGSERDIVENADGTVAIPLWTKNPNGNIDATVMKVSPLGKLIWFRDYTDNSMASQYIYSLKATADSGYIFCGSSYVSQQDAWVMKLDCQGCDSVQCWVQDSCDVYDCHNDSLPQAGFNIQDTVIADDTFSITNTSKFSSGYQWSLNGMGNEAYVNPEYVVSDTGELIVQLIASNANCHDTISKSIIVVPNTDGIKEYTRQTKLRISPNPARNRIVIEFPQQTRIGRARKLVIYNSVGQKQSVYNTESNEIIQVDVSTFPEGLYFVVVENQEGIISSGRFMVGDR